MGPLFAEIIISRNGYVDDRVSDFSGIGYIPVIPHLRPFRGKKVLALKSVKRRDSDFFLGLGIKTLEFRTFLSLSK